MIELPRFIGKIKDYRKALHVVFTIHIMMFCVTFIAAIIAKSTSVLADSLDFIGDAVSYGISLFILNRGVLFRACISIAKATTMITFGVPVMTYAVLRMNDGALPNPQIMTISGGMGILAHIICIYYLFQYRKGDSNQLSVWICTINDLISNVLTVIASCLVMYTGSILPDIFSAMVIVGLAIYGGFIILKQAIKEIKEYKMSHKYVKTSK